MARGLASDLDLFKKEYSEFIARQEVIEAKFKAVTLQLDLAFKNCDDVVSENTKQEAKFKQLEAMLKSIEKEAVESECNDKSLKDRIVTDKANMDNLAVSVNNIKAKKNKTGSLYLAWMLGYVNVRLWKKGEAVAFKEEYQAFHNRAVVPYILFPLVQLFIYSRFPESPWGRVFNILHQLWMIYYYASSALRENILAANGSSIKGWWLYHHYISMISAVIILLWPVCESSQKFMPTLLYFLAFQGVILFFQNSYQKKRHYVARCLGKAKDVDMSSTETISEKPVDLKMLVPALFLVYVAELYVGGDMIYFGLLHLSDAGLVPMCLTGICLIILGVGNAITTSNVLFWKHKKSIINERKHAQESLKNK